MTKSNTKRALTTSALAMVLCVAMLIGTTFAWFTDTASTAVNKIQAGELEVELWKADLNELLDGDGLKWVKVKGHENEPVLWEPGCTYNLESFRIKNNGDLALKYKVIISGIIGNAELLDAIDFTVAVEGDDLVAKDGKSTVSMAAELNNFEGTLGAGDVTGKITITGKMKSDAGNEYQGKSIEGIGITVYATQDTVEYDSAGNTYDNEAEYEISSGAEMLDTLSLINEQPGNTKATVKLSENVAYSENTIEVKAGNDITIDTNGLALTVNNYDGNDGLVVSGGGTLTLTSSSENGKLSILADDSETDAIFVTAAANETTTLNVQNVEIDLLDTTATWTPNTIHAKADDGGQAVVNVKEGAEIHVAAESNAAIVADKNAVINMQDGLIDVTYNTDSQVGCVYGISLEDDSAVLNMSGGTINVTGGHCGSGIYSYGNASTINVTGGTFNIDATAQLSGSGYNFGIEACTGCTLNVSGATFNVKATGGTLAAAVALGSRVNASFASDVIINVYQTVWTKNWSIVDYNTDNDLTKKVVSRIGTLTNNAVINWQ